MNKQIKIGERKIGEKEPVYIIAEMSANHLQNLERAKEIIRIAKEVGADAIKLQTYKPSTITIDCKGPEFMATKGSIWEGQNLFQLYEKAYLPWEWHEDLYQYAEEVGIPIFSSPFDHTAVELLEKLKSPAYKVASYEILDIPLIREVASKGKPVILSTGIATLTDIQRALQACKEEKNEDVIILKCVSQYPTPYENINLRTIENMRETFDCIVGLSDHSMGSAVAVAAVSLGCKMIEKHLTISRNDGGPDGAFSMEPSEFKKMVDDIRIVEKSLGHITYELTEAQSECRANARSLYVVEDIKEGERFTKKNVRSIRPGLGLPTWNYDEVLGRYAIKDIPRGTALQWEMIR